MDTYYNCLTETILISIKNIGFETEIMDLESHHSILTGAQND